ncbi:MAG: hypothetical protein WCB18_00955 [Thermoplasmata archaeon]
MPLRPLFNRPTTVFLGGSSRPVLNRITDGLALDAYPGFLWTDGRISGELFDKNDLFARNISPPANRRSCIRASSPAVQRGLSARAHPPGARPRGRRAF